MITEAMNAAATTLQKMPSASEQIAADRKKVQEEPEQSQESSAGNKVQPEELLNQIKALTEDGLYSVRFENDARSKQMIVKIVNSVTQEVIRQVPAEALLGTRAALDELQGNLVDTSS